MSIDNPFDPIKDIDRSTKKVDFIAVSPSPKEFKENIIDLFDTDINESDVSTISKIHTIVGNFGTGKSHVNHYLLDRAEEKSDILVSFVSCKEIIPRLREGQNLFEKFV